MIKSEERVVPIDYRGLPASYLLDVFTAASKTDDFQDLLKALRRDLRDNPTVPILFPVSILERWQPFFLAMAICTTVAGTYSPSVTAASATINAAGTIDIAFGLATGATAGCSVSLGTVQLQVGSSAMTGTPIYRTATATPLPGAGAGMYTGNVVPGVIAGGVAALRGTTQNLQVTFNATNTVCDTCALAAGATNPVVVPVTIV